LTAEDAELLAPLDTKGGLQASMSIIYSCMDNFAVSAGCFHTPALVLFQEKNVMMLF
jgi:hypothetical protein